MNKLSNKFIMGIVFILVVSSICSIIFNTQFIERFYLLQKKQAIIEIANEFESILQRENSQVAMENIEASYKVIIVQIDNEFNFNNDWVNEKIQTAFQDKGIGFQKYWFWEEDYKKVLDGEHQIRLYQQEKLDYSLLITYMKKDTNLYAITMIVPNVSDAFHIANNLFIIVTALTIFIMIIFIMLFIRKITKPLHLFDNFAKHMKNNNYIPIEIHTKDELESVANNLNAMGKTIMQYQNSLQEKNMQMEHFLDNVAHELKTPISLIQLYANGINDGIDDGTFLETILEENKHMANMINQLLYLSQIENKKYELKQIDVSDMLLKLIHKYSISAKERHIKMHSSFGNDYILLGVQELLQSLFSNLISNAIKYSSGKEIFINLFRQKEAYVFTITNETTNDSLDIEKIWTPYYVGEQSRNKHLSGTGLGLSIVKKICETQQYRCYCEFQNHKIVFSVFMPF